MNALANVQVGKYLNEYFVSSFQKVGTFRIVDGQKQGGNVASYFCAPDGRVLHVIPGPVDAATMLREAHWVVGVTEKAIDESKGDGAKFKALMRQAHARKLQAEAGLAVEPVLFDPVVEQDPKSALQYSDPTGQPLAPKLPPPPLDGPDVQLEAKANATMMERQKAEAAAPEGAPLISRPARAENLMFGKTAAKETAVTARNARVNSLNPGSARWLASMPRCRAPAPTQTPIDRVSCWKVA